MSADTPASNVSPPRRDTEMQEEDEEEDTEMLDADAEDDGEEEKPDVNATDPTTEDLRPQREPRVSRKDKDLHTFLNQMDKYAPIVQCLLHLLLIFDP